MDALKEEAAVGISLGTTNCCVGVWKNNRVEIVVNEWGSTTIPCHVAFPDIESDPAIIGEEAKRLLRQEASSSSSYNAKNHIFDIRRLIGRIVSDPLVQESMTQRQWPFSVVGWERPAVEIEQNGQTRRYKPEEITAMILKKTKETAQAHLGKQVKHAVIAVPADFTDAQRQVIKDAAKLAGLIVLRIMNEPTAAAIAYGLDNKCDESQQGDDAEMKVLVFDLGGSTLNISIVTVEEGIFEVKAGVSDFCLGGDDFDNRIAEYLVEDFRRRNGQELAFDRISRTRLFDACERAKVCLSKDSEADIQIDSMQRDDGLDYSPARILRLVFEESCADYFEKCLEVSDKVLRDAKLTRHQIDRVVLVGGSSRIPKIQSIITSHFKGAQVCNSINPEEVVAHGATGVAARLSGEDKSEKLSELPMLDIIPLSYGVETACGTMMSVVERHTAVPVKKTKTFSTCTDNQTSVMVKLYDGERMFPIDNMLIAKLRLDGLPPMPRGEEKVEVCVEIGLDGIIHLTATVVSSGAQKKMSIVNAKFRLTQDRIDQLVAEASLHKAEDEARKRAIEADSGSDQYEYPLLPCK